MSPESTSALSVSSGSHGGATVIRAVGDLDYDYAPAFRQQLIELWATAPTPDANTAHASDAARGAVTAHPTDTAPGADTSIAAWLVIDLSGLTFCDSTGLAELLWVLQRSRETGTRLVLAGTNRTLRHMLTTTGLLSFFEMADSVEEALERR
ncbi:STAS domain-containing protein [Streptosporangium saharense]|uniref:STAS domain-containing protein n=1 Tax=Streptosporangium saharense TaxID=1706840 RepID=UPI0034148AD9